MLCFCFVRLRSVYYSPKRCLCLGIATRVLSNVYFFFYFSLACATIVYSELFIVVDIWIYIIFYDVSTTSVFNIWSHFPWSLCLVYLCPKIALTPTFCFLSLPDRSPVALMLHLLLFYNVEHIYGVLFLVVCLLYITPRLAQQVIAQVKKKNTKMKRI